MVYQALSNYWFFEKQKEKGNTLLVEESRGVIRTVFHYNKTRPEQDLLSLKINLRNSDIVKLEDKAFNDRTTVGQVFREALKYYEFTNDVLNKGQQFIIETKYGYLKVVNIR